MTNDETRDDNNNRRVTKNQQRLKRRLEHSFRVVTQLPIHFAPQQIQE